MTNWQEIVVALGSAGIGGILLKLGESWLSRSKDKSEQARLLRDELRGEATNLRAEISTLKSQLKEAEQELDDMRTKYWEIFTEYKVFKIHVQQILIKHGLDPKEFE